MDRLLDHSFLVTIARDAVGRFYAECPELVAEPALERAKTGRVADQINGLIRSAGLREYVFADYDYRKNLHAPKELFYQRHDQLIPQNNLIVPDIVVHQPLSREFNAMVFELKEAAGDRQDDDIEKLKGLTYQKGVYRYQLGVAVQFTSPEPTFRFFVDAHEVEFDG